jgi:hypothetical protein
LEDLAASIFIVLVIYHVGVQLETKFFSAVSGGVGWGGERGEGRGGERRGENIYIS